MCVSCGAGVAPASGEMWEPIVTGGELKTQDEMAPLVQMSEDGQRVFFQTTAQLVPQDTNSTAAVLNGNLTEHGPGLDVYEWEADGAEEGPGVFCSAVNGCTHLISSGEDVGQEIFLGASENGHDLFFATAAQLVPQATPEFGNIYDARVDGGFAPVPAAPKCSSCQGVGAPPPLFGVPASGSFAGAGNPAPPVAITTRSATVKCRKGKKLSHGKCVAAKGKGKRRAKRAKRATRASHERRGR